MRNKIPDNVVATFRSIQNLENAVTRMDELNGAIEHTDALNSATEIFRKNPGIEEIVPVERVESNVLKGETIRVHEIALAAFLELKGIPANLVLEGRRVLFVFPATPEVRALMHGFSAGENVPAVMFSQIVKKLKTQMFIMRDSG